MCELNFYLIRRCTKCSSTFSFSLFNASTYLLNSRSTIIVFPLLHINLIGLPLSATKQIVAPRQRSLSDLSTISIFPANTQITSFFFLWSTCSLFWFTVHHLQRLFKQECFFVGSLALTWATLCALCARYKIHLLFWLDSKAFARPIV